MSAAVFGFCLFVSCSWPCLCGMQRRCPPPSAVSLGMQVGLHVLPPAFYASAVLAPGVMARRCERASEYHAQGQLIQLAAVEAQTADAVFYLRHLILLPWLRLGQRGPLAGLIATRLR